MAFRLERADESDYRLLGLSPKASRQEVKAAFRRLAMQWHPDRFQQRPADEREAAEEKFKTLTSSYRRIAAGWIEEEPTGEKRPRRDPTAEEDRQAKIRRGSGRDRSIGFSGPFPWRGLRPAFLTLSLLLAGAGLLFHARHHSPVFHEDQRMAIRPDGATFSPSPAIRAPASEPESRHGIEETPSESLPAQERSPEKSRTGAGETAADSRAAAPPHSEFISIGSTQEEVLRIQGPPQVVRGQTWVYGISELGFKDGRVARYNNFDGSLKISVFPSRSVSTPPPAYFTIGSSADEVLAVQGTPTRMDGNRWSYGFSEIRFKDGKVEEYDNFFGDLKIRMVPNPKAWVGAAGSFFTVGSSADEVLAVQGTPTSVRGNLWYYEMSSVLFKKGKVHYVFNLSGNLRYVPKEELTRSD